MKRRSAQWDLDLNGLFRCPRKWLERTLKEPGGPEQVISRIENTISELKSLENKPWIAPFTALSPDQIQGRREAIVECLREAEHTASGILHLQVYGDPTTGNGEREPHWQHEGAQEVLKVLRGLLTWWPEKGVSHGDALKALREKHFPAKGRAERIRKGLKALQEATSNPLTIAMSPKKIAEMIHQPGGLRKIAEKMHPLLKHPDDEYYTIPIPLGGRRKAFVTFKIRREGVVRTATVTTVSIEGSTIRRKRGHFNR